MVKDKMKELWMKTFQDSKDYVNLVFDTCYNPDYAGTFFDGDRLVASLLGVEYTFLFHDKRIRGLYLCGLATHPDYRGKGIMTGLMKEIEHKAKRDGFAFTFLIPADKGLHGYYRDRGYLEGIYNVKLSYTSIHDFKKEYFAMLEKGQQKIADIKKRYFMTLTLSEKNPHSDLDFRNDVLDFLIRSESATASLHLCHTRKDMEAVIAENKISKGDIIIVEDGDSKIVAVGFVDLSAGRDIATVLKVYSSSNAAYYKCLSFIKSKYADRSMKVVTSANSRKKIAVMEKGLVGDKHGISSSSHLSFVEEPVSMRKLAKCYGMIKILNLHEVLKFQAESYKTSKFSILVREPENDKFCQYIADKGALSMVCEVFDSGKENQSKRRGLKKENAAYDDELPMLLSESGICALLCRRPDSDNLILDAFGLPPMNIEMSLLLD